MDYMVQLLWKISWQAALVAGVVWAISRLAGKAPAAWRHALWLIVLVKFFVPPFAYFPSGLAFWQSPAPVTMQAGPTASIPASPTPGADASAPRLDVSTGVPTAPGGGTRAGIPGAHDIIALTWLAGVFVMAMVLVARRVRQRRLLRGSSPVSEGLTNVLRDCASRLGVGRVPNIRLSEFASTPMLVGFFRPTILLPPEIAESCSRTDLSAMLLHELAHIKRRDMAGVWLHQLAQVFFFFHPAVWLAGRELKREREPACDEMVLGTSAITRQDYAAGYVSALELASGRFKTRPALAMAEPFEIEKRRLDMILRGAMPRMSARWAGALLLVAAVGLPTFAGVGTKGRPDVPAKQSGSLLELVKEGTRGAVLAIKSGKGKVTVHKWQINGRRFNVETESIIDLAFAGERYRLSTRTTVLRNDPNPYIPVQTEVGSKIRLEIAVDGKKVTRLERRKGTARIGDGPVVGHTPTGAVFHTFVADVGPWDWSITGMRDIGGIGYSPSVYSKVSKAVVGRELVDGNECLVVEVVWFGSSSTIPNRIVLMWVDPEKGFTRPRVRTFLEGGRYTERTLVAESNVKLKEYSPGVWYPQRVTQVYYKLPTEGEYYKYRSNVITYDPDFQINVPVSEEELSLDLPSGTRVYDELLDESYTVP